MNTTYQDHIPPIRNLFCHRDKCEIEIDFHVSDNATER